MIISNTELMQLVTAQTGIEYAESVLQDLDCIRDDEEETEEISVDEVLNIIAGEIISIEIYREEMLV